MVQGSPKSCSDGETRNSEYCLKGPAHIHVCCTAALYCWREVNVNLIISFLYMRKKVPLFTDKNKGYFARFLICIIRGMICFALSNIESFSLICTVRCMNESKPVSALTH